MYLYIISEIGMKSSSHPPDIKETLGIVCLVFLWQHQQKGADALSSRWSDQWPLAVLQQKVSSDFPVVLHSTSNKPSVYLL